VGSYPVRTMEQLERDGLREKVAQFESKYTDCLEQLSHAKKDHLTALQDHKDKLDGLKRALASLGLFEVHRHTLQDEFPLGMVVRCTYDGFEGDVIGYYTKRD